MTTTMTPTLINGRRPDETMTTDTPTVQLKRRVTVKTKVTDLFRQRAKSELSEEHKTLETQQGELEAQYQQTLKQLEAMAGQGQNVQKQLQQLNEEYQRNRNQLTSMQMQLSSQLANLDRVQNGDFLVTGTLENNITLSVGDNLYEKLNSAELIVEDGIIKSISP
ncbi:MAG: YlqD family protein [Candidatus Melainabacteria bacterium]